MAYRPKHAAPAKNNSAPRRVLGVAAVSAAIAGVGAVNAGSASAAPTAAPGATSSNVWDRVAACESGGRWNINTGNGYYGGLQFSRSTWLGFGGGAYAPFAHQATKAQQIAIAQKTLAKQGPGAWPTCSKRAGLTRTNGGATGAGSTAPTAPANTNNQALGSKVLVKDGRMGPRTIAVMQRWLKIPQTGALDYRTRTTLQRYYGVTADGVIGPKTIAEMQKRIGMKPNGAKSLDRATVLNLQIALNKIVFKA